MNDTRPLGVRQDRFTRLPDVLLSALSPREHQLVHALLSYKWFEDSAIYPSVRTLSKLLGWSPRTVQRTLRSLEDGGWIVTIARYRDDDGQTSNEYRPGLMLLPYLAPSSVQADAAPHQSWQGGPSRQAGERNPGKHTNRTGRPERDYYATRDGRLPMRG